MPYREAKSCIIKNAGMGRCWGLEHPETWKGGDFVFDARAALGKAAVDSNIETELGRNRKLRG